MSQTADQSRILIAESEDIDVRQHTGWLAESYRVEPVATDTEVLSQLDSFQPDILLLDSAVLGIHLEDLLKIIDSKEYTLQIILIVDEVPDFDIVEAGFDTYVQRPLTRTQVQETVAQSIHRAEYNKKLNELYTLTQRRAELEVNSDTTAPETDSRHAALTNRIKKLESEIDALLNRFDESIFRAVMKQTQTIAAEQESEQRYRSMTEEVLDSSRVGTLILDSNCEVVWANSQLRNYLGLPADSLVGSQYLNIVQSHHRTVFSDPQTAERLQQLYTQNATTERFECRIDTADDRDRWLEHWSKPIETGLYSGGRVVRYYDITTQKRRSQALRRLHTTTRELMETEQQDSIVATFVTAVRELIEVDIVEFYSWDDSTGQLELTEYAGPHTEEVISQTISEQSPVWDAFIQREKRRLDTTVEWERNLHAECTGGIAFPIESYGVVLLGVQAEQQIDDVSIEFARVLTENLTAVLDRTQREQHLRERDEQLSAQNTQLERLERINTIIRKIGQTLVSATSQTEIETQVCSRLSQIGSYNFVWIGHPELLSGTVTPKARAGDDTGYLEQVEFTFKQSDHGRSMRRDEPELIPNLAKRADESPWRRQALNQGYRSVFTVPVRYEEATYAVLELCSDRPAGFPEREQTVIAELGETIGHAIHARRQREALVTDQRTELELQIEAPDDTLIQFARVAETDIEIQSVISDANEGRIVLVRLETHAVEDACTAGRQAGFINEVVTVRSSSGESIIKCRVASPNILDNLSRRAATVERIWVNNDSLMVSITVPESTNVRSVVQRLKSVYPAVELAARREQYDADHTTQSIRDHVEESLTQRQQEVLHVAHQAGFFDWPRANNSKEVAEMLDIAQPTFLEHLRAAERKIIDYVTLFRE